MTQQGGAENERKKIQQQNVYGVYSLTCSNGMKQIRINYAIDERPVPKENEEN